jgi:hypothetical protein
MTFFELYKMNIPQFFPSPKLLAKWDLEHGLLKERSWKRTLNETIRSSKSDYKIDKCSKDKYKYDPNDEVNPDAISYWMSFSDFYQFPHLIYFDSWADLLEKALNTDFLEVSNKMKLFNLKFENNLIDQWNNRFFFFLFFSVF